MHQDRRNVRGGGTKRRRGTKWWGALEEESEIKGQDKKWENEDGIVRSYLKLITREKGKLTDINNPGKADMKGKKTPYYEG